MKTGFCIICRKDDRELSDEHVIPDALGGVYHIYNVCKDCNSRLGEKVDRHLIDHWLSQGFRHIFKIKGKKGNIPNPLTGPGVLESGQRVKNIEDESGSIRPVLIPSSPQVTRMEDGSVNIEFSVDATEEKNIDGIINRLLKRNGIEPTNAKVTHSKRVVNSIEKPTVTQTVTLDIHNFKLTLLKIAYEFAVDRIPGYMDDLSAKRISKILHDADTDAVTGELFFGSGFADSHTQGYVLSDCIDYNQHRHILILVNMEGSLYGIVHISNIFCGAIKLSDRLYGKDNNIISIAINDVLAQTCTFYTLPELVNAFIDRKGAKL